MNYGFFVRVMARDERAAAARRDEEFRAWHRRPDALPLPADEPREPRSRAAIVPRLLRVLGLRRAFGR